MTKRAWRILSCDLVISCAIAVACVFLFARKDVLSILFVITETFLGLYCASHIISLISVWLLKPVEKNISDSYINEAVKILRGMPRLKVVGITGSYGKTSTKHFLKRILDEKYSVTMTPGSFNTTMGVVRTIREYLRPYDQIFIVEMGAKQPGDIKEICELVKPRYGILTAVGEQHLESFKNVENIRKTKFELIDSLPSDGLGILNNDFPQIEKTEVGNVKTERYGVSNQNSDWKAYDIRYSTRGTTFKVAGPGIEMNLETKLVGEGNISNLLGSVAMAYELGLTVQEISRGVKEIEPVEHRLSMKRTANGIIILDDAFNSNPAGAKMALDVLRLIDGERKIIVTPGMIELGEKEYELNKEFGRMISKSADIAIVVGSYNRESICEGLTEEEMADSSIRIAGSFSEAQIILSEMMKPGDVVLYENDLPDTFK